MERELPHIKLKAGGNKDGTIRNCEYKSMELLKIGMFYFYA